MEARSRQHLVHSGSRKPRTLVHPSQQRPGGASRQSKGFRLIIEPDYAAGDERFADFVDFFALAGPARADQIKAGLDPKRFSMRTAPALLTKSKPGEVIVMGRHPLTMRSQSW